jgi:acyl-coenzyme A thioesterase PaaI-like protein
MAVAPVEIKVQNQTAIPKQTLQHFTTVPIAQPTLQDSSFRCLWASREVTDDGVGHTLMGKTWSTESTIPHLASFYKRTETSSPLSPDVEVRRFYTLGGDLNAHPNLLHGGVIGCILDSTLGSAVGIGSKGLDMASMFTVQLNVKYEKPVRTPGTICARATVKKIEDGGKNWKVWAEGVIESLDEDGKLVTHSKAEGMWLGRKGKPKSAL